MERGPYHQWLFAKDGKQPRQTRHSQRAAQDRVGVAGFGVAGENRDENDFDFDGAEAFYMPDEGDQQSSETIHEQEDDSDEIEVFYPAPLPHMEFDLSVNNDDNVDLSDGIYQEEDDEFHSVIDETEEDREVPEPERSFFPDMQGVGGEENVSVQENPSPEPLHPGSSITKDQLIIMVMSFVLMHHLVNDAFADLIKMLNLMIPNCVPRSVYLFKKCFGSKDLDWQKHFYCECGHYIGTDERIRTERIQQCCNVECVSDFKIGEAEKSGRFFAYIPIESQIRSLLEEGHSRLIKKSSRVNDGFITDVFDGKILMDAIGNGTMSDDDLTICFGEDGAKVFNHSPNSITPLQISVLELPMAERKKNILLCGLWFGQRPNVTTFLRPFVEEMKILQKGLKWTDGEGVRTSCIFLSFGAVDAIARAPLANIHQFNGEYGCHYCEHPGVRVPSGKGTMQAYPLVTPAPKLRSAEEWEKQALKAADEGAIQMGIKGVSILLELPDFDIVWGLPVDYLHALCRGVISQMCKYWFDKEYSWGEFSLRKRIGEVENRLKACKPPKEVSRTPTSPRIRTYWNASDYRHFATYYSLPSLKGLLPNQFYEHWSLLVYAVRTMLSDRIREDELPNVVRALDIFVARLPELYGKTPVSELDILEDTMDDDDLETYLENFNVMTYNMHQLRHIVQCITVWGHPCSFSTFAFEGNNRFVGRLRLGTQHVIKQICSRYVIFRQIPSRAADCISQGNEDLQDFFISLLGYSPTKGHVYTDDDVHVFCRLRNGLERDHEWFIFFRENIANVTDVFEVNRLLFRGKILESSTYCKPKKRQNNVVVVSDERFVYVERLFIVSFDDGRKNTYFSGKYLAPVREKLFCDDELEIDTNTFMPVVEKRRTDVVFPITEFISKAVSMTNGRKMVVCQLMNHAESD